LATPAVLWIAGKSKDLDCPACSNRGFETKKQFRELSSGTRQKSDQTGNVRKVRNAGLSLAIRAGSMSRAYRCGKESFDVSFASSGPLKR
jgi:hypothetical protein